MRKLSVCTLTYGWDTTLQHDVDATARLGIEGITLAGGKVQEIGLQKAKRLIRDAGLKVAGYHGGVGWYTLPGDFKERVENDKRRVEEAAELEADILLAKTGPLNGLSREEATRRHLEGMHQVAPFARERGVDLAIEPSHPISAWNSFVNTFVDTLEIASQVEGMGVLLDLWHVWWDPGLMNGIRSGIDRIYNVQVNDYARTEEPVVLTMGMPRAPLGEGMIPIKDILSAVDAAGYERWYDIEVIGSFSPERQKTLVADCKAYFEALWD